MRSRKEERLRLAAAALIPPTLGTSAVYLGAVILQDYGWMLFVLLPAILGFTSTVIYAPRGEKSYWRSLAVGLLSIVVIGVMIIATAIEGLICLAMALPLAVPLLAIGVLIAWAMTRYLRDNRPALGLPVILFLLLPLLMGFEASEKSVPTVRKVVTTVEIDAPIETVWENVIEFPEIEERPDDLLALGFAYPINARIEGRGLGAVRYCNFNTGPFVEPITVWDEPNMLAFDVVQQPAPMVELTPYREIQAAHLEYIRSQKGQFRLFERDGKTVLEGTTFYTHDIAPDIYWQLFSDEIIHRIHRRVLEHIKKVSETAS